MFFKTLLVTHCRHVFCMVLLLQLLSTLSANQPLMTCPASRSTVSYVEKCPKDEFEWLSAALKKNCSKISQNCSSDDQFLYHCLINSWENSTLEVCARRVNIIGKCAEYNYDGAVVQEHMNADCKNFKNPCPDVYLSDTAYLYQECYNIVKRKHSQETPPVINRMSSNRRIEKSNSSIFEDFLIFTYSIAIPIIGRLFVFVLQ
ncbi:uncharacterized protein LOC134244728 [Saccostrea cucullata]|uniref:uncharacterized protein LOC134244728 n=1 Tax=Saccostrea cuccullata TaxID=36930 RepID=UPI002ED2B754